MLKNKDEVKKMLIELNKKIINIGYEGYGESPKEFTGFNMDEDGDVEALYR